MAECDRRYARAKAAAVRNHRIDLDVDVQRAVLGDEAASFGRALRQARSG